eukprot:1160088-Pelagomonas_calceolata.AAC.10
MEPGASVAGCSAMQCYASAIPWLQCHGCSAMPYQCHGHQCHASAMLRPSVPCQCYAMQAVPWPTVPRSTVPWSSVPVLRHASKQQWGGMQHQGHKIQWAEWTAWGCITEAASHCLNNALLKWHYSNGKPLP